MAEARLMLGAGALLWDTVSVAMADTDDMRTVRVTIDERLAQRVDKAVRRLGTTRSAFTRDALEQALTRLPTIEKEERHRRGYARHPVAPGEFDGWTREQAWSE